MSGHHLILGTLTDLVTGETLEDTLDERYRQKIARLLLEEKGFRRAEIEPRRELLLQAGERRAVIRVDFIVRLEARVVMVIRFGPGSLVSRERPTLAVSRLLEPYQVPLAVVTNGEDAEVLEGESGRVVGRGLDAIPARAKLAAALTGFRWAPIPPERSGLEARIAFCYEIDDACPCDETICRL
ncbi:MAG: type I restriction enzyme HsdR N-terminal domain-containing protein [Desulfobacterales bacterium]